MHRGLRRQVEKSLKVIDAAAGLCISSSMRRKSKPKSIAEIIDALGGPTAMAQAIGTSQPNVQGMKERRSIPYQWWPVLIPALKSVGVRLTAEDLLKIMTTERGS